MARTGQSGARRVTVAFAVTLLVSLVGVALAPPALAHDPIFLTDDQTTPDTGPYLPDGGISWAIYGVFPEAGQTRGFEFDLREGDELYIQLLIPNLEPELSLSDAELPYAELTMPDGSVRTMKPEIREIFDEEFSKTSYVTLVEIKEPAVAGRHSVVIHSQAPSRFVVPVGAREEFFTPADRTENRPTNFPGIAAPLNAWYQTPPGADPSEVDGSAPAAQIDVDNIEDALEEMAEEEGPAETEAQADVADETAEAESEVAGAASVDGDDDGSGLVWVLPVVIGVAAVGGAGFWLIKRRSAAP